MQAAVTNIIKSHASGHKLKGLSGGSSYVHEKSDPERCGLPAILTKFSQQKDPQKWLDFSPG